MLKLRLSKKGSYSAGSTKNETKKMKKTALFVLILLLFSCESEFGNYYVTNEESDKIKMVVADYMNKEYPNKHSYIVVGISKKEKVESKSKSNYQYKNTTTTNKTDSVHYYSFTLDSKYNVTSSKLTDAKKKVGTSSSCTCGAPNKTGGYCKRKVSVCGTRCWQH